MTTPTPIPNDIGEYMQYDPNTGKVHWIKKSSKYSKVRVGQVVGTISNHGYLRVLFKGQLLLVHRIIFSLMRTPIESDMFVDHINGDRLDNRWVNLRITSRSGNNLNQSCHRDGHLPGTSFDKERNKWRAVYKGKTLGRFKTEAEAHNKYLESRRPDDY